MSIIGNVSLVALQIRKNPLVPYKSRLIKVSSRQKEVMISSLFKKL